MTLVGTFFQNLFYYDVLDTFLYEVYEPAGECLYSYRLGSSSGSLVIYDNDKFAYSQHGTDPIVGKLVNSFDLVQLHKFGNLDDEVEPETPTFKLPSYLSMIEFAQQDGKARRTIGEERILNAAKKFSEIPE